MIKSEIKKNEILKYLGYQGQVLTDQFQAELDQAITELLQIVELKNIWKTMQRDQLQHVLLGKDIISHLGNAEQVILLAATLGQEVDFELRRSQNIDMKQAVILDATASVIIETYLDQLEDQLREQFFEENLFLSTRFSPGYGDMPLNVQQDFLQILDANRKIGVHIANQGLMLPMKSVTCVMGILEKPISKIADPCSICLFRGDCALKRRGGYCGKFRKKDI